MSIQVKTINEHQAKQELKVCPKIVRDYVKALQSSVDGAHNTMNLAVSKVRKQARKVVELREMIDKNESNHDYDIATETIRIWINDFEGKK